MKVLLVNFYYPSRRVRYMLSSYALKGYFDKNSIYRDKTEILVENFSADEDIDRAAEYILNSGADIVGFSCYLWNIETVRAIIPVLSEKKPELYFLLGGPEITVPENGTAVGFPSADVLLLFGEGEAIFTKVVEYIFENQKYPTDIKSTAFLPQGTVFRADASVSRDIPEPVDLSLMPLLYKDGIVPIEKYRGELVFLETQRGCKYKCRYCVYHGNIKGLSRYPFEAVEKELEFLLKEADITSIRIIDADFASDLNNAKKIIKKLLQLQKEGYTLKKLMLEYNYYDCDEEFLSMLAELKKQREIHLHKTISLTSAVGFDSPELMEAYTVISGVGIQSFSNDALKSAARRPIVRQELESFFESCKRNNLMLKLDMILGLPMETKESYLNGLNTIVRYIEGTDHIVQIALLQILPGSIFEKMAEQFGFVYSKKAPHYVLSTNTMTNEELGECSRLTGLLFRIINSPLRRLFYERLNNSGTDAVSYTAAILEKLEKEPAAAKSRLIASDHIDDDYWGNGIYRDFPPEMMIDIMRSV